MELYFCQYLQLSFTAFKVILRELQPLKFQYTLNQRDPKFEGQLVSLIGTWDFLRIYNFKVFFVWHEYCSANIHGARTKKTVSLIFLHKSMYDKEIIMTMNALVHFTPSSYTYIISYIQ
ncbi:hypothetical protein ACP275_12G031500 [Erythranthe tilingii]